MKSVKILGILLCIVALPLNAQNYVDALRISEDNNAGTARNIGMAGSFGALGGDFTAISKNPAGLGVYRSGELVFTPRFNYKSTNASVGGFNSEDYKINFNLGNIGYVGTFKNAGVFESINWSIGYTQLNNYSSNILVDVSNPQGSLLEEFTWRASQQINVGGAPANGDVIPDLLNPYYEYLAAEVGLIYQYDGEIDTFYNIYNDATPNQWADRLEKSVNEKGKKGQYSAALAFNYEHKVYFGGEINFVNHYYNQETSYREYNANTDVSTDDIPFYPRDFSFNTSLYQYAKGVNFKAGVIVRPVDFLRIGAAIHSPTFYNCNEEFSSSVDALFFDGGSYFKSSQTALTDYKLRTPMRLLGSVALQIKKLAVINVDYERIDYSESNLSSDDNYSYSPENNDIEYYLTASNILRAGAELNLNPVFLRGGYSLSTNPLSKSANVDLSKSSISGGIGFKAGDMFLDFAARRTTYKDSEQLFEYVPGETTNASIEHSLMEFIATIGFRF